MGTLTLAAGSRIYVDTVALIYSVETFPDYWPLLKPLWQASSKGEIEVVTSELSLMEVLVGPLKKGDQTLARHYEDILLKADIQLLPISREVLKEAALIRAGFPTFRTPDAIHGATARLGACATFITNDGDFRRVSDLSVVILDELLG